MSKTVIDLSPSVVCKRETKEKALRDREREERDALCPKRADNVTGMLIGGSISISIGEL